MAIEKKLICCKTQANFDNLLASGDIHNYSIVFIQDTQSIWTHGTYFSGTQALQDLLVPGANITMEANEDGTITISSTGGGGGTAEITLTAGDNVTVTKTGDNSYEISGAVYTGGDNVTVTKTGDNSYEISAASSTSDTIEAGTNITVTKDNGTITISGAVYNGGDNITITDNGNNTYTISAAATESETIEAGENITVTTDNGKIIISAKKDTIEAGENITVTSEDDVVTISAKDTTYTLSYDEETDELVLEDQDGNKSTVAISASGADTKNTAGAELNDEDILYLVGAKEQTENPETNSCSAYSFNGELYDKGGVKLASVHDLEEVRADILNYMHDYCFMIRTSGDSSPEASSFYGDRDTLTDICSHFRMAAVRGQGDYDFLAPLRVTLSEDGKPIMVDGSDGDIMVATDTTIYLYSELVSSTDGDIEIYGIGLAPMTLYDKAAVGYEPFAMTSEAVNCQLTSSNTDHIAKDDVRKQLHSIYNENVEGHSSYSNSAFSPTYKADGSGYCTSSLSTITNIVEAQAKNEDENTNSPYLGLYYRFVEIWLSALYCEMGTRDIHTAELFGAGDCYISELFADASNWIDDAQSATIGYKIVDTATFGNPYNTYLSSDYYSKKPMLLAHRVIDAIQAKGNMEFINNKSYFFDEEGNVYDNLNVNLGSNMEAGKRYFSVRDVAGAESFSDGVMTGVLNMYVLLTHTSDGYTYIFKDSMFLYRGFNFCPGHLIFMQGFHAGGNGYFFQRDPSKIGAITSSATYNGEGSDFAVGYDHVSSSGYSYSGSSAIWGSKLDPSVSMFCCTASASSYSSGASSHTYLASEFYLVPGTSSTANIYCSAFGGCAYGGSGYGPGASAAGRCCGVAAVSDSDPGFAAAFSLSKLD